MAAHSFTMEELRECVPLVQHGTPAQRDAAQSRLLRSAEGLITFWARQEHTRARMQFPTVELEDVRSIVMLQFVQALDTLDLSKLGTSSTNWLYHRVVSATRRELTTVCGQVRFSRYFLENSRRVRAITARLEAELGRTPTDAEILTASSDVQTGGTHMGPKGRTQTTRVPLTQHFLDTYRTHARLLETADMPADDLLDGHDPMSQVEDAHAQVAIRDVYRQAAHRGGVHPGNLALVFCTFGIDPYDEPASVADTARICHTTSAHVSAVLRQWMLFCSTPHSAFHGCLHDLGEDTAYDLGLGDALVRLGDYDPAAAMTTPALLGTAPPTV